MPKSSRNFIAVLLAVSVVVTGLAFGVSRLDLDVLNPGGIIAASQRDLIVLSTVLGLLVVIPVFALTIGIAWHYRAGNDKAVYAPEFDHSKTAETIWWGIPVVLIAVLSVIIWQSSHLLDPARPIASAVRPLEVQVVALQWKWLFIYPEQGVASVNYLQIPAGRPVRFTITSDAPMNSFWIPKLGGQIYAMPGMSTTLSLQADAPGTFEGSSANLSGEGFAKMHFPVRATTQSQFDSWATAAASAKPALNSFSYGELARPSVPDQPSSYYLGEHDLYDKIVMKYMQPGTSPLSVEAAR